MNIRRGWESNHNRPESAVEVSVNKPYFADLQTKAAVGGSSGEGFSCYRMRDCGNNHMSGQVVNAYQIGNDALNIHLFVFQ